MSLNDQPWDIDKVTEQDLIRELNPGALDYYAGIKLGEGWPSYERPTTCKFVRLGAVIFLGSAISFGPVPTYGGGRAKRGSLLHRDIAFFALSQEPIEKVQSIADTMTDGERVLGYQFMVDAGYAAINTDDDNVVDGLVLGGDSFDFGRADIDGRDKTLALARAAVGDGIEVSLRD